MTDYKLYYAPGTCSLAVHIVLHEVGAEFELVKEDIKAKPRNPEFMKINPRGSVPVLSVDGKILREGAAILTYIAEAHKSHLLPESGWERAKAQEWLAFANSTVHPVYGRLFGLKGRLGEKAPEDAGYKLGIDAINRYWAEVESVLEKQEYVASNHITLADILLTVISSWSPIISAEIQFGPKTQEWIKKVMSRPTYIKSVEHEKKGVKHAA